MLSVRKHTRSVVRSTDELTEGEVGEVVLLCRDSPALVHRAAGASRDGQERVDPELVAKLAAECERAGASILLKELHTPLVSPEGHSTSAEKTATG